MQKWIDYTAAIIEAERDRGAAPDTIPARDLATALNLMNERDHDWRRSPSETPAIPTERVLETLVHMWTCAIYGDMRLTRRTLDANMCSCPAGRSERRGE